MVTALARRSAGRKVRRDNRTLQNDTVSDLASVDSQQIGATFTKTSQPEKLLLPLSVGATALVIDLATDNFYQMETEIISDLASGDSGTTFSNFPDIGKNGVVPGSGTGVPSLDEALLIAQSLHIVLRADNGKLKFWHPGVTMPRIVNRVLRLNSEEVLRRIGQSHVSVCPSPELHKHSWQRLVRRDCCDICAHLKPWIDGKAA